MAAKVKSVEQFSSAYTGFIALEKTKGGLGKTFHEAVIMLLNENPNATPEELVKLFRETITEVENTRMAELKEAFGEDATPDMLGDWKQCKSDYKRALELVDRRDLLRCNGWYQVRTKKAEVLKALKERESAGLADGSNPVDNGAGNSAGGKAGDNLGFDKLPGEVQSTLREALQFLTKLDSDSAAEVAENFKNAAAARMRRLGKAKKKIGAAVGSATAEKVAANS